MSLTRLEGGPPGSPHARWTVPPNRERDLSKGPFDHLWVRLMAVVLAVGGFIVRSFAPQAIDTMSLFVIESKGWLVYLLGQGLFLWLVRYTRDRISFDGSVRKLLMSANMGQACPVQVVVRQWGVVTGADQGLAWIEGDRLSFKGVSTAFFTRRSDLPAWVMWSREQRKQSASNRPRRRLPLPWVDGASLEIEILNRHEDLGVQRRAARFEQELTTWCRSPIPASHAESLLPPSDVHPGVVPGPSFVWEAAVGTVVLLLMNLFACFAPLKLNIHEPILWFEGGFRLAAAALSVALVRELVLTVHSQTIRAYCLHHGGPPTGANRSE